MENKLDVFGLTDTGAKRAGNEDSILINRKLALFVVADGMGGHAFGEVASDLATKRINEVIADRISAADTSSNNDEDILNIIRSAMEAAHTTVFDYSCQLPDKEVMGTTVSLMLFRNSKAFVAHVGDSRIYRLRNAGMEKLTVDHTEAQHLADIGALVGSEVENHRTSHVLTRVLGVANMLRPDYSVLETQEADRFLLSSDGLFRVLDVDTVSAIMALEVPSREKCRILIEKTLQGGAPDNVSVIVVQPSRSDA